MKCISNGHVSSAGRVNSKGKLSYNLSLVSMQIKFTFSPFLVTLVCWINTFQISVFLEQDVD